MVERLDDSWQTAPNHSRPATCVIEADIDAGEPPLRDPQKGHGGIPPSRGWPRTILRIVIERG
jgi:hypothetical protein